MGVAVVWSAELFCSFITSLIFNFRTQATSGAMAEVVVRVRRRISVSFSCVPFLLDAPFRWNSTARGSQT